MLRITSLHKTSFDNAVDMQKKFFEKVRNGHIDGYVFFTEHYPVITFGRTIKHAKKEMSDLLVSPSLLKKKGISLAYCNRGGGITYHGPGQLMIYPIINLKKFRIKVSQYLFKLNEVILSVLAEFGLRGEISKNDPGIKVNGSEICAIGIHVSRNVTTHGAALYVCSDLEPFKLINPCGIPGKQVTTMEREMGVSIDLEQVYPVAVKVVKKIFL